MPDLPIHRSVLRPSHADRIERALRTLGFEARVTGKPFSKDVEVMVRDLERLAGIAPPGEDTLPDRYARIYDTDPSGSMHGTGIDGAPLRWKDTVLYGPNDVGGVPTDD